MPASSKPVFASPARPKHQALRQRSYLILKYAHDSSESLIGTFDASYRTRGKRGRPTDEEQDLLRAMVVLAGAGLDSMAKQLIRDALPILVDEIPATRERIAKLVTRLLRGTGGDDEGPTPAVLDVKRLAEVLLADSPRQGVVELLVNDLTSGSLQSAEELYRIGDCLGVAKGDIGATTQELKDVFRCRNEIIHELDIDFSQTNANRFPRTRTDMVRHAVTLLKVGAALLSKVDHQLDGTP